MQAPPPVEPAVATTVRRLVGLGLGAASMLGFAAVGRQYYGGFWIPQGIGMTHPVPEEFAFLALFSVFGAAAVVCLAVAVEGTSFLGAGVRAFRAAARRPGRTAGVVAAVLVAATTLVDRVVMQGAALTDDEHVFSFVARTLRQGALVAPSPGGDLEFFREQFVVLDERVRYGKYAVGHPALLALGQALGQERLVVPVVTGLLVLPVWAIGRAAFTPAVTTLALVLLGLSPQVLLTGATRLAQPASALALGLATACLLWSPRAVRPRLCLFLAGASLGAGLLVRPMPTALFALVAAAYVLLLSRGESAGGAIRAGLAFALPLAAALALLLLVNRAQAGAALTSGYQRLHQTGSGVAGIAAILAGGSFPAAVMSVASAAMRLNVWLGGWPSSLVFLGRPCRRTALLWGMLGAALAYRVVSAKAGVSATGPVYVYEVVPLLVLLVADGMARLARGGRRFPVAAVLVSLEVVSLAMFLPGRVAALGRMADAQRLAPAMIQEHGIRHALVFHRGIVPPWTGESWAYYPPCNGPALDDDVLFVRWQEGPAGADRNLEFSRRRFPDRTAWVFEWRPASAPRLVPLADFVDEREGRPPAR
jgi:hypothetical protein